MSTLTGLNLGQNELKIGGSIVSCSASELNVLDGVTAGTVTASKGVVTSAQSSIQGLHQESELAVANDTLTVAESGKTFIAGAANLVFTLPSTAEGCTYKFILASAGLSVGTGLSISPAAADKIMGNGFTSADNKDAILTGATDREGDCLEIEGDGVDGWYITRVTGTWAREA